MSLLQQNPTDGTFGRGGDEPYARAIRNEVPGGLALREARPGSADTGARLDLDFGKWTSDADAVDHSLLRHARGPVLDIGCGPGRMVRAAGRLGLVALGLDVSPEVVALARGGGVAVALGSVFERVPAEGLWGTVLLIDGNVGIGGDVAALLVRCREILAPSGVLIVEVHPDDDRDHSYSATVVDTDGAQSGEFPWAEVGVTHLTDLALASGYTVDRAFTAGTRRFCRLTRI
ncbi:methyltransferase domain-containing protein [Agreia pratensis]|uniref:Methyltransferase domain-containing protein n=1 Tax=Agreia pratensis TaxID=150121 RepID=A0A1X7JHT1_9MICO|nr:class I SAM-dependent methyltransferase [Agreia pratensis]MBF4634930.1 methyltransferase domain-containing protein [Agreia pratensis]SMG27633.1 Methyltransferase domain-containing protein [Agreia pratensis]